MSEKKNMKKIILKELSNDEFITGTSLAEKYGYTRSYISKIVNELRDRGIEIESDKQKGYRLLKRYDIITEDMIKRQLGTIYIGKNLVVLQKVDSTNNYAKELARKGAPHGTVVIAEEQTNGRGRLGRSFNSPANSGLYYSVIIRPDYSIEMAQLITSCAAVAVAETIDELYNTDTKIKWVNDIFLGGKKVCGILTEASVSCEAGKLEYAVIGIGINVFDMRDSAPPELKDVATSLEAETGRRLPRSCIAATLSKNLEKELKKIRSRKFIPVYKSKSNLIGKRVSVTMNGEEIQAEAVDIDLNANLIIKLDGGNLEHINSGEARVAMPEYVK